MSKKKYYDETGEFDFTLYKEENKKKKGAGKKTKENKPVPFERKINYEELNQASEKFLGSKKDLKKDMNKALKEIENYNLQLYEDRKRSTLTGRRKINKEAEKYYNEMEGIRRRVKIANELEDSGLLTKIVRILKSAKPIVKTLARAIASFIAMLFGIKGVSERIKPSTASHLVSVFNMAMAV